MADSQDKNTFHLGLTMAGAVSGGAYTAGVMDYLFETLDKWYKAKAGEDIGLSEKDKELVPKHNVIIDTMGGTSAGGMTTILAAIYALKNEIHPVKAPKGEVLTTTGNILYETWVNMLDEEKINTLQKALDTKDLNGGTIYSLLNSTFIDDLADKAFKEIDKINIPPYLSENMEMLITHTMNRGIPLAVSFPNNTKGIASLKNPPNSTTYEHFMVSHFKLNDSTSHYLKLDPTNPTYTKKLREAAKATGAFPVGLRFREFDNEHFSTDYLDSALKRIITNKHHEPEPDFGPNSPTNWYKITAEVLRKYKTSSVDGGAINNEPFGEILEILKKDDNDEFIWPKGSTTDPLDQYDYQKSGVVMIDPFPDLIESTPDYEHPQDLIQLAPKIVKTLWNQSKVKRKEMREQYDNKAYRGTIFPVKHKFDEEGNSLGKYEYPLASGTLEAFGGFLDRSFREHDFFLGRNNARNFMRAYMSMPYKPEDNVIHPIHRNWTPEMINRFKIRFKDNIYLPIIPDLNMLLDDIPNCGAEWNKYTVAEFPKLTMNQIRNVYYAPLNKRINRFIVILRIRLNGWLSGLIRIANRVLGIHKKLTNKLFNTIEKDLSCKGFLEGHEGPLQTEDDEAHT